MFKIDGAKYPNDLPSPVPASAIRIDLFVIVFEQDSENNNCKCIVSHLCACFHGTSTCSVG